MIATIQLVVITAVRDRFFAALFGLFALVFALAFFLGSNAVAEQLAMSVTFAAGAARLLLVLGLVIFVAFHIQRLFDTREVEAILSRAISREVFLLAYWSGFALLAVIFVACLTLAFSFLAPATAGIWPWAATILIESFVVIAVAIFAGAMLERATSVVMFAIGFYALARLIGYFVGITIGLPGVGGAGTFDDIMNVIMFLVPRLDLLAQTEWLIYGPSQAVETLFAGVQSLVFMALVLSAAMFDLHRKQF